MDVILPSNLHEGTISYVIRQINDADGLDSEIVVNFSYLSFVYPIGALALAQYLKYNQEQKGRVIKFVGVSFFSRAVGYLDSVGFFKYFGESPFGVKDLNKGKTYIPFSG